MNKLSIYIISYIISSFIIIIGALFKIMHWPFASILLATGLLFAFVYIIIALIEIFSNKQKSTFEKIAWLIGFIVSSGIVGLVYFIVELRFKGKKV